MTTRINSFGDEVEIDEIVVFNNLDLDDEWIPVWADGEVIRENGQEHLSIEQYEALGRYARESNWWDGRDDIKALPDYEQGKIAMKWIDTDSYFAWLDIPDEENKQILYERFN